MIDPSPWAGTLSPQDVGPKGSLDPCWATSCPSFIPELSSHGCGGPQGGKGTLFSWELLVFKWASSHPSHMGLSRLSEGQLFRK